LATSSTTRRGAKHAILGKSVTAAVLIGAAAALAPAAEPAPALEVRLAEKVKAMECPGALVGIFPDEGPPRRFALGVADVDAQTPMALDMHLRTGSVAKPFLGVVALELCDEGKLSLDDPVSKYVPDVPDGDRITVAMLGRNTSGLFNTIENKDFQKAVMQEPEKQWTPAEVLAFNAGRAPYCRPGERWRYSNANAVLLALCVEKVTGRPYAVEIAERVCRPLRLEHTAVPSEAELPAPHPSAYRNGYPDKVIGYGNVFYNVSNYSAAWTGAAGNMYSTLDDLCRAARPLAMGELLGPVGKKALDDWLKTGHEGVEYSFCTYRRDGGIGHTGDVPGYNAFMFYYPELHAAVVALTNLSNNKDGTMPAEELGKLVREHLAAK
jgi:D-alanyl-D-alanine carboxypeptidase